ncbi:hypothetical protein LCGC14_2242860, partial [marine sediment metagenome]
MFPFGKYLKYLTIIFIMLALAPATVLAEGEVFDYSDAPASYGIASHEGRILDGVYPNGFVEWLGPDISSETAPPGVDADTFDDGVSWTPVQAGESFDLTFSATFLTLFACSEKVNVEAWLDLNGNGVFDTEEKILDWFDRIYSEAAISWCGVDPSLVPTIVTTPIVIPPSAVSGPTWMRVRLWYYDPNDSVGVEADADPTGNIVWGEVEDYQLNIAPASGGDATPPETSITSAPAALSNNNSPSITYTGTDDTTSTPNLLYATFLDGFDAGYSAFGSSTTINYSALADGTYTFNVKAKDEAGNEDLSPAQAAFQIDTVQPT